jgi:hypoxanthine-DNA glycosylase
MKSFGFPPVARADAKVLILGSLPGKMSLEKQQYYAQPQNAFWRIMGELAGAFPQLPYAERLACLGQHHIALWDVCAAAERPGSLDSAIAMESVEPNDFKEFFEKHAQIGHLFFNGAKAAELYRRLVLPALPVAAQALARTTLPSTSPAHAGMRFEQKLGRWRTGLQDKKS